MSLSIGIVGLPNVGKSTLFNALTKNKAEASNYPFCTIDPNVGVVEVPDERLEKLASVITTQKIVPAIVEFVDIAGIVKGASKGEGLGNKFLANIRECDATCEVIRVFTDKNVTHVVGKTDPSSDIETIKTELILADLETVGKRVAKLKKDVKGNSKLESNLELAEKLQKELEAGKTVRELNLKEKELEEVKDMNLLTLKPHIYIFNVDEESLTANSNREARSTKQIQNNKSPNTPHVIPATCPAKPWRSWKAGIYKNKTLDSRLRGNDREETLDLKNSNLDIVSDFDISNSDLNQHVIISAKIESELNELSDEEKREYLEELGQKETGLNTLIKKSYELLGLQTYFTAGEKEIKAWTIHVGDKAPQAAGVIHGDFEKGFIKAETVSWGNLVKNKGWTGAKSAGKVRLEGKDYIVKDGDVMVFKFNI